MPIGSTKWTHKSVKSLGANPIETVVKRARSVTLEAMADGWSGPPFDPIDLATRLGIAVEPRDDIADARTIAGSGGMLRIEFNPNRPHARVRYSIAHEIAHTFFPDCADTVRNRTEKTAMEGDDWQLEMLCNIAAAELVMPIGSFPDLRDKAPSIDELMLLRSQYEVSIEALVLRYIRLTRFPCALFAASRVETGAYADRYRLDYAVASQSWNRSVPVGKHLPDGTLVADCTAIGFTAKGTETFPDGDRFRIECVGASPYPGNLYPRVLGLLCDPDERGSTHHSIHYVNGDALKPRGSGPHIIAHVVNDKSLTWGGGFAKKAAIKLPEAQVDFRRWGHKPGNQRLGMVHLFGTTEHLQIASMVAQQGFGRSDTPRIRYPALQQCLGVVCAAAQAARASVHMPRIGCGQAGGKWEVVGELVERELVSKGVSVTVYDLPNRSAK